MIKILTLLGSIISLIGRKTQSCCYSIERYEISVLLKRSPLCRPACNAQSGGRGGGDVRHGGDSSFNSGAAAPWPCSGPASASESAAARRTEVINWLRARRSSFNSCLPVPSSTGKARRKKSLKHLPIPSFENIQNGEFRIHCAYFWTTQKKFQVHNNNIHPRFARWAFSDESARVSHCERSQISWRHLPSC